MAANSSSLVAQFISVTGATKDVAKSLLEACNNNLEMAIDMHLESQESAPTEAPDTASTSTALVDDGEDSVRAPIPQTRGVLVEERYHVPRTRKTAKSVFDAFRDFQAEAKQQELLASGKGPSNNRKLKTLQDLFRPPIDLIHKGTFETAKLAGQQEGKWLLVNVQDVKEFRCQQLNRDVWSHDSVRNIVRDNFTLWQIYHDSDEGERFIQFYHVSSFPYIAVLDPRTGEKIVEWNGVLDAQLFCDLATEFTLEHSLFEGAGTTPPAKRAKRQESIIDASEDSQLEAAIAASLSETTKPTVVPSDEEEDDEEEEPDDDAFDAFLGETIKDKPDSKVEETSKKETKTSTEHCTNAENTEHSSRGMTSEGKTQTLDFRDSTANFASADSSDVTKSNGSVTNGETDSKTSTSKSSISSWTYSASDGGLKTQLVIRFPDGIRKQLTLTCKAPILSLVQYVQSQGYPNERFELVTTFPRRKLSSMDYNMTLEEAGLYPQETVFVQER